MITPNRIILVLILLIILLTYLSIQDYEKRWTPPDDTSNKKAPVFMTGASSYQDLGLFNCDWRIHDAIRHRTGKYRRIYNKVSSVDSISITKL